MVQLVKRELYGGAITMDLPADMIDASMFRQIPDTQEVYVSKENPDYSIIIDLLECVPATTLYNALDEHMQEITRLNGATLKTTKMLSQRDTTTNSNINSSSNSETIVPAFAGVRVFEQQVAKFGKQQDVESVVIAIGLVRLPSPANSDILITVNNHVTSSSTATLETLTATLVHSLSVVDPALFVA
ncbi:multicopy suppressor of ts gsp1 [Pichia californica]|uniref:Multicopy suppressor of ts gsp1 n=1 Tax=Pichia californica TaxID=460514 RepID=A0A9P7BFM0_9ASCO|nr:multicopy suppressor of ts gsp1 [[Candida] californica]KAG0687438.1 multicopy suppressor of ts gsp1 [[Candida] californica]